MTGAWPDSLPAVVARRPLGGGDVAGVELATLADGREVVCKRPPYDARLEAEGLRALGDAGAPVPAVVHVDAALLVLERVGGPADWRELGRAVATMHGRRGPAFGWPHDNVIGPLPQRGGWHDHWPSFFVETRLLPHLEVLPPAVAARLERAAGGPLPAVLDRAPAPSLVHGDLWIGNVVDGRWLIDPAVHHADREVDLAMLALFGDAPPAFHEGYREVWPLADGWRQRRPALQLAPLLVHVRLFGGGYVAAVERRLDELGV
jgi:fructosamine-3-kinase